MYSQKQRSIDKKRKLRYVTVYNKIYEDIKNGKYPVNTKLPGENKLASEMKVSRMTLRQALSFLQDDGIIKTIKGKGNYIISNPADLDKGLENISNPVLNGLKDKVNRVEINIRIEKATDYTNKILKRHTGIVVFIDRWYIAKGKPIAYGFSTMPADIVSKYDIDLDNEEQVIEFIEKKIYQKARYTNLKIQFSKMGNVHSVHYKISDKDQFFLIQEKVYFSDKFPIIHNKFYLPVANTVLDINRYSK